MRREIYSYTDLSRLWESSFFEEIKSAPIVTVTSELRKGLASMENAAGLRLAVTDFHSLSGVIYEDWASEQSRFGELLLLSAFCREKLQKAFGDRDRVNWLTGCMRGLPSMLSSIIELEEAGARPEDFFGGGERNLDLFLEAWRDLAEKDPEIRSFRERQALPDSRERWEALLAKAFAGRESFAGIRKIVFHGFYYITPLQEKVMRSLEAAGFGLIMLIPYDERAPFVHEIWAETYSKKRGYPPKSRWRMESSPEENPCGEIFEGNRSVQLHNRLTLLEYNSVMEFVNDVKKIKSNKATLYAPDYRTANQILKDYYPEDYGERKLLSYPLGQFIDVLCRMWDEERQAVILDGEMLIGCFASGWLSAGGVSSRGFLKELSDLLPFFDGCRTVPEWSARIKQLKQIRKEAEEPFLKGLSGEGSDGRWQRVMGNPLGSFGMFSSDPERLYDLLSLIGQVLSMARELFGEKGPVRASVYIKRLNGLLRRQEISSDLYEEEKRIAEELLEKLARVQDFEHRVAPFDLARALHLYLCEGLEEGEIRPDQSVLVRPLYQIDAALAKKTRRVHVCLCDVTRMPDGEKKYLYPLTGALLADCYQRTENPLLINLMQIKESGARCNRYFIYSALKNPFVTISWISRMGDKKLAPSPYIRLLCDAAGQQVSRPGRKRISYSRVSEAAFYGGRIEKYEKDGMMHQAVREAKMDYAVCPMRYLFGYVLEKRPAYSSSFQQGYALHALVSAIYELTKESGMSLARVCENVLSLFPGLRKAERRQVYDDLFYEADEDDLNFKNRTECGGLFFTDERIRLCYPNWQVRKMALDRYAKLLTPDGRDGMDLYEGMEAGPKETGPVREAVRMTCIFCPQIDCCRNAIYYLDQEALYD